MYHNAFHDRKERKKNYMKLQNNSCLKTLSQPPLSKYLYILFLYDETTNTWFLGFSHTLPKELEVLQSKVEVYTKI